MRVFLFAILFFINQANAQEFELDNWNQQNSDLGNNTIQVIEIDQLGKLWVGTDFGLYTYDGEVWESITTANSTIASDKIRSITFDDLNHPWVGTFNNGITYYNGEQWNNFTTQNSPLPNNFIKDLKFDINNILWIASIGGFVKKAGEDWFTWNTSNTDMWSNHITSILVDKNTNDKYVGTMNGGLLIIKEDTLHSIEKSTTHGIPDNTIYGLAFLNSNELWTVAPSGGLMIRYSSEQWLWYNAENSDLPSSSYNAIQTGEKAFLGSQDAGVVIHNNEDITVVNTFNSNLATDEITNLKLSEDENFLWIGTSANGLYRLTLTETADLHNENTLTQINVSPNPTSEKVTISNYTGQLSIYSLEGKLLTMIQVENNTKIDVSKYSPGIYILKTANNSFKLIKQ